MESSYGKELCARLIELGIATPDSFDGCTQAEIDQLKTAQGVTFLPQIYQQFLLEMGKSAGGQYGLFQGQDFECSVLMRMKETANQELEYAERTLQIPDDAFVFLGHQGYQFWYFLTSDQDENPPIYSCFDGAIEKVSDHLSTFLDACVEEAASYRST